MTRAIALLALGLGPPLVELIYDEFGINKFTFFSYDALSIIIHTMRSVKRGRSCMHINDDES